MQIYDSKANRMEIISGLQIQLFWAMVQKMLKFKIYYDRQNMGLCYIFMFKSINRQPTIISIFIL